MDKIVDHLFVFRGKGIVEDFPGNYSDYRTYEDSKPKEKKIISEQKYIVELIASNHGIHSIISSICK